MDARTPGMSPDPLTRHNRIGSVALERRTVSGLFCNYDSLYHTPFLPRKRLPTLSVPRKSLPTPTVPGSIAQFFPHLPGCAGR